MRPEPAEMRKLTKPPADSRGSKGDEGNETYADTGKVEESEGLTSNEDDREPKNGEEGKEKNNEKSEAIYSLVYQV